MKRGKRREARGKKKNMKKKIALWLLATLFLANSSLAEAQQTGKIFRIGFLDPSNASGSRRRGGVPARTDASLDGSRVKISPSSTDLPSKSLDGYLSLRRSWFVSRLI